MTMFLMLSRCFPMYGVSERYLVNRLIHSHFPSVPATVACWNSALAIARYREESCAWGRYQSVLLGQMRPDHLNARDKPADDVQAPAVSRLGD